MTDAKTPDLREALIATTRRMVALGLNRGRSGNLSARCGEQFLITPSGIDPADMGPDDLVLMDFDGSTQGSLQPSSEWRFHRDILAARPEIDVVLHAHPIFSTALACLHRDIPPFHYMVAMAGGVSIRCAPYATFGSQDLSDHVLTALVDRRACLLANHGMIALGRRLSSILALAVEVEALCNNMPRRWPSASQSFFRIPKWRRCLKSFAPTAQRPIRPTPRGRP